MKKKETSTLGALPDQVLERGREVWLAGLGTLATLEQTGTDVLDRLEDEGGKLVSTLSQEGTRLINRVTSGQERIVDESLKFYKTLVQRGEKVEKRGSRQFKLLVEDVKDKEKKLESGLEKRFGKLDDTVSSIVENSLKSLEVPTRKEVGSLIRRIESLSKKVEVLADRIASAGDGAASPLGTSLATKKRPSSKPVYHVVSRGDTWAVKKEGVQKPLKVFNTKEAAVERGKELAKGKLPSRLVVHKQDGRIQEQLRYGS